MIITSQKLLTMRIDAPSTNPDAIVISEGVIRDLGTIEKMRRKHPGHRILCLENAVLLPGLVNVHTHLELPALLDAVRAKKYPDWLMNLIHAKKKLDSSDYKSITHRNINALMECGTTTVGDICTHGVSSEILKHSGLRGVTFQELISMGQDSAKFKVHGPQHLHSRLVSSGISPHSAYTVSEAILVQVAVAARQRNVRIAMHVAESKDESRLLLRKKNGLERLYRFAHWDPAWAPRARSPVEYLHGLGVLSQDFLAVHAVQVDDHDIAMIRKAKATVAHCPRSNKETGVGRMPLRKFLDAGITVGLGTDSLASSPSLNMWDEMRYALRIHTKDGVTAHNILRIATIGGAKALGLESEIGSFEPGKKADIIAVPLPKKNTGDFYSDLLRETNSCIMSIVNGKILFSTSNGKSSNGFPLSRE